MVSSGVKMAKYRFRFVPILTDGGTDKRTDRRTDEWKNGRTDEQMNGRTDGRQTILGDNSSAELKLKAELKTTSHHAFKDQKGAAFTVFH